MSNPTAGQDLSTVKNSNIYRFQNILQFVLLSVIGAFIFFVSFELNGVNTIPLDHLVTFLNKTVPIFGPLLTMIVCIIGGALPFINKTWKKNTANAIFSIFKVFAIFLSVMAFFKLGPEWLQREDMLPFLYNRVTVPVAMVIPFGALFLTFLTDYGLMEFFGVLMQPIMRPVWHVPGKAAINAVTSFVGNFSVGILMTNRLYTEGKLTNKEAAIIMTGFSTVSAAFMVIVAKTSGLMDRWNMFFWTALIITFAVSAIMVRLKPLKSIADVYYTEVGNPEPEYKKDILKNALYEGLSISGQAGSLVANMWRNFKDGCLMLLGFIPVLVSVGLLSFILIKMTPVFDILAYIYYPFTLLVGVGAPMEVAKGAAVVAGEMFIPSAMMAGTAASLASKYTVAIVSISTIVFFSGTIPCIVATDVDISVKDLVIIMFERTAITILIAGLFAKFLF